MADMCDDATWATETKEGEQVTGNMLKGNHMGINPLQAKSPDMAVLERRKATFLTYPYPAVKHAEELYDSGYYFNGRSHLIGCCSYDFDY